VIYAAMCVPLGRPDLRRDFRDDPPRHDSRAFGGHVKKL
jgi:hypothetical protein